MNTLNLDDPDRLQATLIDHALSNDGASCPCVPDRIKRLPRWAGSRVPVRRIERRTGFVTNAVCSIPEYDLVVSPAGFKTMPWTAF
jgi:hypothetical protein